MTGQKKTAAQRGLCYLFTVCAVIQIWSMITIWQKDSTNALYALIAATLGEAIAYCAFLLHRSKRKKITTAKFALGYIFVSSTVVQVYSMVAMWHFTDLSALYALIGATVGEAISYCAYTAKSAKENTKGGITYEAAMREQEQQGGPQG